MPVQVEYFPLVGGLDVVTPYFNLRPGQMIECANYECLPEGGYRRIDGYMLYDGSESAATVPGEGAIRGVWVFKSEVYAIRDQASEGGLFKATASGWQAVDLGQSVDFKEGSLDFIEGELVTGGTGGATATIERVIFSGGTNGAGTSFGRLVISGVVGSFVDGETLSTASGAAAKADGAEFNNSLPKGGRYVFDNNNFFGQDGLERMYGAGGAGDAFEFDGTVFAPIRVATENIYPEFVVAHKQHLILGFAIGSLQTSSPGEPLVFDPLLGAAEISVGDTITSLKSLPGGVLAIGCQDSVQMLYGNDSESWEVQQFTDHGVKKYSFAEVGGNTLALDDRGVQNIRATQAYGDFEAISQSRPINPLILGARENLQPTSSVVSKTKSQYRIFFGKEGYYFSYSGDRLTGITPVQYAHPVLMSAVGENENGKEIIFFGSEDGQVFQANSGYHFYETNIVAFFRIAFIFERQPTRRKQYRKAVLDIQTEGDSAQLIVKPDFDFRGGDVPNTPFCELQTTVTGGGTWDFSAWDDFNWSAPFYAAEDVPLAGVGRNMSLSFTSLGVESGSHTIFSAAIHYSMRRLDR